MVDIQSATAEIGEEKKEKTRMWASAQRDGRPGARAPENVYIVYHSTGDGQTSSVWLASVKRRRCGNEAKTQNPLKFDGVPLTNETISGASGPKFTIL